MVTLDSDHEKFLDKMFRRSKSLHSRRFYQAGLRQFAIFVTEKKVKVSQKNVYSILDSFMEWLDGRKLRPKTQVNYLVATRRYLRFTGIKIDDDEFRERVTVPRVTKIPDEPLTIEDVRALLTRGRPNPKMRALILTLLSSGMRLGEALGIKVKDVDLKSQPSRITIPAEITKGGRSRLAYMSDEAKAAIEQVIQGVSPERLVFPYSGDAWQREKVAIRTFRELAQRSGLGERLDNHRTHRIHFHSFRKFFFTKAADLLGEHAAHALTGHGFYMDTYYRKSEEERAQEYARLMPRLTVLAAGEKQDIRNDLAGVVMKLIGFQPDELAKIDIAKMSDQEIQEAVRKKLGHAGVKGLGNGSTTYEKVIRQDELPVHLEEGYGFVSSLASGDVVVRFPSN